MSIADNKIRALARVIYRQPSKRYLSYIRSQKWGIKRQEHLERCEFLCEICGFRPAFQVHHWRYDNLGDELPCELCAVCVWDHHRLHCAVFDILEPANDNQLELPLITTSPKVMTARNI